MNDKNVDIKSVLKTIDISETELEIIKNQFEKIHIKKGTILLNAGEQVTNQYYVSEGCLRAYFIDDNGKEHTVQFAVEDWWISDYTAFFTTSAAILNIECIQDATLYRIARKDSEALLQKIPQLEVFFRKKMERAFASFQKRILSNLSLPAKERYRLFIEQYPTIEPYVKNYHIASYLGITTESLSRIRKEITFS